MRLGLPYIVRTAGAALLIACLLPHSAIAQREAASEYRVKAAFLYNFAKFVEWPPEKLSRDTSTFVVGIFGNNPFSDELNDVLRGKMIGERRIVIREVRTIDNASGCHILFVSASATDQLPRLLSGLDGKNVLTVGDDEDFASRGTVISFMLQEGKIRFAINVGAAAQANLHISSKLLNLARIIPETVSTQ